MNSVLNVQVSCFKNCFSVIPIENVNLLTYLKSDKLKQRVEKIRSIKEKKERDKLKIKLPAITPASTLHSRDKKLSDEQKINTLSGLMQFDIDLKGNEHVKDWEQVKTEVSKFPFVAFISLSVSGRGLWGLVPIEHPTELKFHFDAIIEDFKKISIKLDSSKGSNPTDLRGYSFDLNAYFNHNATKYTSKLKPLIQNENKPQQTILKTNTNNRFANNLLKKLSKAPNGERHTTLTQIAFSLGGLSTGQNLNEYDLKEKVKSIIKNDWGVITYFEKNIKTLNDCFEAGKLHPFNPDKESKKELFKNWKPPQKIDNSKFKPLPPVRPEKKKEQIFYDSHYTNENLINNVTKCNTIKKETRSDVTGWNITELENYFNTIDLHRKPFFFKPGHEIINLKKFVYSHFEIIKAQTGNETYEPYLLRLKEVKKIIEVNQN